MTPTEIIRIAAGSPAIIGIVCTVIALFCRAAEYRKHRHFTEWTTGTVTELVPVNEGINVPEQNRSNLMPVFEYWVEGNVYRKSLSQSRRKYRLGEASYIVYDNSAPAQCYIEKEEHKYYIDILTAIGIILMTAAFLIDAFLCVLL